MPTHSTDIDHVLKSLASESVKQGGNVRAAVRDLTVNALQQRELTLDQIRRVLRSVAAGVNLGVAEREVKVEKALADTVAGMDDALLKAVQASNVALRKLTGKGYDYQDSNLKQALDELEGVEDAMFRSIATATESAGEKVRAPWGRVLKAARLSGTAAGAQVASTLRDYAERAQAAMREQRETSFKTAHLLTQNFATLASGILIGMSEGLGAKSVAARRKTRPAKKRTITKAPRKRTAASPRTTAAKAAKRRKTTNRVGTARRRSAK
ncbi:hypothetical protein BURK1_02085 [Burkholderiales bacterium]|nr:hypothetical protein BURK1_02085 [Burkholderiales bacterium]